MSRCHERSSKTAEEGGKKPEEEQEEGTTTTRVGEHSELFRWTSYHFQYREKASNLEQLNRFDNDRCEGTSTIDNVAEGHLETIGGRKEKKR